MRCAVYWHRGETQLANRDCLPHNNIPANFLTRTRSGMEEKMKLRKIVLAFATVTVLLMGVLAASCEPKGTKISVKGEVVDLWCYLEGGDHGAKHKDCAVVCAKAGNPIGIVDAKGNVFVAMGIKDHQPGREVL